jgi:hypothetical protein
MHLSDLDLISRDSKSGCKKPEMGLSPAQCRKWEIFRILTTLMLEEVMLLIFTRITEELKYGRPVPRAYIMSRGKRSRMPYHQ